MDHFISQYSKTAPDLTSQTILVFDPGKEFVEIYKAAFSVVEISDHEGRLWIVGSGGQELTYLPQQSLALIVPPPNPDTELAIRIGKYVNRLAPNIPVIPHHPGLANSLRLLGAERWHAAEQNSRLMLQLADLRKIHEELHNGYDALRTAMSEAGVVLPRPGFVNVPDAQNVTVSAEFDEIVQPLPVEFRLLCGLSLHIGEDTTGEPTATVQADLIATNDESAPITWLIPARSVAPGWLTFAFEQQGTTHGRNLSLRLRRDVSAGPAPRLSLGKRQLRHDKAAIVDGERLDRSLAFKLWVSVPGAPLNVTNQLWPAIRLDAKPVTRIDLVFNDADIIDLRRLFETASFRPVSLMERQQQIIVHPLGRTPTIARLADACPVNTAEIWAEVETVNERAGLVEYGLAVLPHDLSSEFGDHDAASIVATVDWTVLPAKTHGHVSLILDKPLQRPTDLALLTRVPEGAHSDACWAAYKRIYFKGTFS